jgi:hypothetical protein
MNQISKLNALLLEQLIADLKDPAKCTPGLYQVIRGIITDNRDQLDSIPVDILNEVETMLEQAPFKFGS